MADKPMIHNVRTPKIRPISVVFCDEVRREISGKEILLGVYSAQIVVPAVPTGLSMSFWIQTQIEGEGAFQASLRVTDPSGNIAGETMLDIVIGDSGKLRAGPGSLVTPPLPMTISELGPVSVYWREGEGEFTLIGSKEVTIGSVATVFGTLPVQPLPAASTP